MLNTFLTPAVARMAYDILQKEDPAALQWANDLLKVYSDDLTK